MADFYMKQQFDNVMNAPFTDELNQRALAVYNKNKQAVEAKLNNDGVKNNPKEKASLTKDLNAFESIIQKSPELYQEFMRYLILAEALKENTSLQKQELRKLFTSSSQFCPGIDTGRSIEKHSVSMVFTLAVNAKSYFPILIRAQVIKESDNKELCQQYNSKRVIKILFEKSVELFNRKGERHVVEPGEYYIGHPKANKGTRSTPALSPQTQISQEVQQLPSSPQINQVVQVPVSTNEDQLFEDNNGIFEEFYEGFDFVFD